MYCWKQLSSTLVEVQLTKCVLLFISFLLPVFLFYSICLTGGPGAHLCCESRSFTHHTPGQSRHIWTQGQQSSSQSSGMLLNFSSINMLGAPSHGSWTALRISPNLPKAQLILKQNLATYMYIYLYQAWHHRVLQDQVFAPWCNNRTIFVSFLLYYKLLFWPPHIMLDCQFSLGKQVALLQTCYSLGPWSQQSCYFQWEYL